MSFSPYNLGAIIDERVLRFAYIQIFNGLNEKKVPDESCRHCGGNLIDYAQCAECKKVICMICKSCKTKTAEQYHNDCILGKNLQSDFLLVPLKSNQEHR